MLHLLAVPSGNNSAPTIVQPPPARINLIDKGRAAKPAEDGVR
jgi:hypothetical protein